MRFQHVAPRLSVSTDRCRQTNHRVVSLTGSAASGANVPQPNLLDGGIRSAAACDEGWLSEYGFVVRRLLVALQRRDAIDEPRAGLEPVMSQMQRRFLGRVGAA